uniref:Uncharacterized protein n=1 Tax=Anopheles atroparvus TaxID=41427 RepID=A0AAG5DDX7_ANOAO
MCVRNALEDRAKGEQTRKMLPQFNNTLLTRASQTIKPRFRKVNPAGIGQRAPSPGGRLGGSVLILHLIIRDATIISIYSS